MMNEKLIEEIIYSVDVPPAIHQEIIDADWKEGCGLALLLKKEKKREVLVNEKEVPICLPSEELGFIRWINRNTILVAAYGDENGEENLFVMNLNGEIIHSFHGGMATESIAVGKEGIWVSYFDEGTMGTGISTEGLVLFDVTGKVLFRYHSDLLDSPEIFDCYAIGKGKGSTLWLFPYTDFPLVLVNPKERTSRSYSVPEKLRGSHGLCIRGKFAYFFDPYNSNRELYQLKIGEQEPQLIGTLQGRARGLDPSESCHFIAITEQQVLLYQVLNEDEYNFL